MVFLSQEFLLDIFGVQSVKGLFLRKHPLESLAQLPKCIQFCRNYEVKTDLD